MQESTFCSEFAITLEHSIVSYHIKMAILYVQEARTLAKYLHGVSNFELSVECEKGQALPA